MGGQRPSFQMSAIDQVDFYRDRGPFFHLSGEAHRADNQGSPSGGNEDPTGGWSASEIVGGIVSPRSKAVAPDYGVDHVELGPWRPEFDALTRHHPEAV